MGRSAPLRWPDLLLLLSLALGAAVGPASAQPPTPTQGLVVRDNTLGSGRGEVVGPGTDSLGQPATYLITPELGEQHGGNLFHSFQRFGIGKGETATFTGPDPVDAPQSVSHVISRVTGGERSEIDGRLRSTIPGADVWLLNPSGVVFGETATLDVRGSFHAGAGDYVSFADGERFDASPARQGVLTTAPPAAFGFLPGSHGAPIVVDRSQLEVDAGKTLELVAGDLTVLGTASDADRGPAQLASAGGHVRLEAQDEIELTQAHLDVGGALPGTISIRGGEIVIQHDSTVLAENESPVPDDGPGSISVVASESVLVDDSVLSVDTHGAGNAGTIRMVGPEDRPIPVVAIRHGPGLPSNATPQVTERGVRAYTTSSGAGGRITIDAGELTIAHGVAVDATAVGAESPVARGPAGTVEIHAHEVEVSDRAYIGAAGWGSTGPVGAIRIDLGEGGSLLVDGASDDPQVEPYAWIIAANGGTPGRIEIQGGSGSSVEVANGGEITTSSGIGDAGTIEIETGSLVVRSGGYVGSDCGGSCSAKAEHRSGDAATIRIAADHLLVEGNPATGAQSQISASAYNGSEGDAGRVILGGRTRPLALELLRGGAILAQTLALTDGGHSGNGGEIRIDADSIRISGQAAYGSGLHAPSLDGWGRAGDIFIKTRTLDLGDPQLDREPVAGISTRAFPGGDPLLNRPGSAGNIQIKATERLSISSWLNADTGGAGLAGNITLDARSGSVVIGAGGTVSAGTRGAGHGGTISISANSVQIGPGQPAIVNAGSSSPLNAGADFQPGDAGTIEVTARESILLTNRCEQGGEADGCGRQLPLLQALVGERALFTGIFSATVRGGDAGDVALTAPQITVTDLALVGTTTLGGGKAGNVALHGSSILVANGGAVDSTSMPYPDPRNPRASGDAGRVTLVGDDSIVVQGGTLGTEDDPHENLGPGRVSSFSLGTGAAGEVTLRAPNLVVDGGLVSTTKLPPPFGSQEGGGGASGAIHLEAGAGRVLVKNGGRVDASTFVEEPGGGIDVTAEMITVEGEGSGIASRTGGGKAATGGRIALTAPRIEIRDGGEVSAQSAPGLGALGPVLRNVAGLYGAVVEDPGEVMGDAGRIELASEELRLDGGRIATSAGPAEGGAIVIRSERLLDLDHGSEITASTGDGTGGEIAIDPDLVLLRDGSTITAGADEGHGGQIRIAADLFFGFPGTLVSAISKNQELSGTVEIHSPDVNLAGTLAELPTNFLDAASQMKTRCAARQSGERVGSFSVRGPGGIPAEPDGWLPAPLLPDTATTTAATDGSPLLVARLSGPLLLHPGCL